MSRYLIVFLITICSLLTSCQTNGNIGDLYGQWQLTDVQLPDSHIQTQDAFFAFQNNVIFCRMLTDAHYAGHFQGVWRQEGDSLLLSFYTHESQKEITQKYLMLYYYMYGDPNDLRFGIQRLDEERMILTQGDCCWSFRKF